MATRNQSREAAGERGTISVQMLVILVPVLFGMMGFAVDLGRLYLIRSELQQAAHAMALSGAAELVGTQASLDSAGQQARLTVESTNGNRYNFGSIAIGTGAGLLSSSIEEPEFFATAASALGGESTGLEADGSTAKYLRVLVRGDAPLLFWSMLSLGRERSTPIVAQAVAGISAPLCQACGIEPIVVAARNLGDIEHFGFEVGVKYTLGYECTPQPGIISPPPGGLAGTTGRIPFLLLNHFDENSELEELQQAFRIGAQGMLPSTNPALACVRVTVDEATEVVWVSAAPLGCATSQIPAAARAFGCGIYTRFETATHAACQSIADVDGLAALYQPDSDISDTDDYAGVYAGNQRRIITIPIVESLSAGSPMTVVGFRQFLVLPQQGIVATNPGDNNGRFPVLYLGSVAPVRQGRFDGCILAYGPGKVVLHQ